MSCPFAELFAIWVSAMASGSLLLSAVSKITREFGLTDLKLALLLTIFFALHLFKEVREIRVPSLCLPFLKITVITGSGTITSSVLEIQGWSASPEVILGIMTH